MKPEQMKNARILVVDDESANVAILAKLLAREGYKAVVSKTDSREAVLAYRELEPDLVLLDLHMPHMDGFQVMAALGPFIPRNSYLPILILTGDQDQEVRQRALASGAKDFVTKPFEVTEVLLRIRNLLETRFLHLELAHQNETLEFKVRERTRELAEAQVEILNRLALAAEYRDDVTGKHAERVGIVSSLIAKALGLHPEEARLIRQAAPLHDVGKIGIPDAILMKPGPLTTAEFEVMKTHAEIGGRILSGSGFPLLQMAREIALFHHEKWDGSGYQGTVGDRIPLVGRIVAVADAFDSLTHERPYKQSLPQERALEIIREDTGSHFDPQVSNAFMAVAASGALRSVEPAALLDPVVDGVTNEVVRARLQLVQGGGASEGGSPSIRLTGKALRASSSTAIPN